MTYDRPVYNIDIDENFNLGVNCIGLVDEPAIEIDFIKLQAEEVIKLAQVADKQLLVGPLLIPDKKIFRVAKDGTEYYITFSADTIRKIVDRYFKQGNQVNFNIGHNEDMPITATVNESWIIEDTKMDKSALYGFELPVGTWMLSTHIEDTEDWNTYVKSGVTKGYSIEGNFAMDLVEALNKVSMVEPRADESKDEYVGRCIAYHVSGEGMDSSQAAAICYTKWDEAKMSEQQLESYSDYPEAAKEAAARGIKYNEENGNKCATQTGKVRAQQIANGEPLSYETLKRTYSFLSRAKTYYNPDDKEACGTISYLLWGGEPMFNWVESKLNQIQELRNRKISWDFDGVLSTRAGKEMVRRQIRNGEIVYIISARNGARSMYSVADELGIPRERIYATGNNTAKIQKIKELQIVNHYDNNPAVVRQLPRVGVKFSITPEEALQLITEILKKND